MSDVTVPEEFDPIFNQQVLVVGGHAVNLWASNYASRGDPELVRHQPFVSKDADIFLPDPEMALAVAASAGWEFRHNWDEPSAVLGFITLERDGKTLTVDVMRRVTGLSNHELMQTEEIKLADGRSYVVPPPELMLQAKLWNVKLHPQERRQDVKHVGMMVACCRHYLADACQAVVAGRLSEAETLLRFAATRQVISTPEAEGVAQRYGLKLAVALPDWTSLGESPKLKRIRASYTEEPSPREKPKIGPSIGFSP